MPTGPPDPSPPVEADLGPSHDTVTAELLDLTWQFLTHAAPAVRAELGQFLADHGQHPVAGLGGFLDCLQLSAARHHPLHSEVGSITCARLASRRNVPAWEWFLLAAGRCLPDADSPDPMNPELTVRTRLPLTVALATALLLTSCGGDSDEAGGGSASGSEDVLRVATEGTYAPFSFHDPSSNELTGYDVEVAEAVGAELGMEVEFSETQFDAIFAGLEADRYDVIANQVTVNPEREEKYLFSAPYTVSTGVVITRADDDSVTSIADVRGKRSAQSTTSSFAEVATEAGAQIEAVEGFTQAITLLKQERVDVTINDSLAFLEYQKSTGDEDVKIAAEIDQPSEQALVFRKDSADLQARVDEALTALRADGTLARISEKYFGEDVSGE